MEGGPNKSTLDYFLEKISPLLGYFLILFPFVMSFINVNITVIYLAAIYVYFVYKSAATAIQFMIALNRIRTANQINWVKLANGLRNIDSELLVLEQDLKEVKTFNWNDYNEQKKQIYSNLRRADEVMAENAHLPTFLQKFLFYRLKRKTLNFLHQEIDVLKEFQGKDIINPDDMQHIIIVPHVKEPESILRDTLDHLKNQTFNTKQINVVLAAEAADPNGVPVSEKLREEYKDVFNNIWITNHVLSADEIVGKSANMNWAGRTVYKLVKEMGWDLKKTTVTSCDADSKLDPQYFAYLTYKYITTKFGEYKYYTSALIFYNNIWRLPFYARVKNSSHTIFNTANLVRDDKLIS
ncbi:hypothetical protein KC669_03340 [Candidatus Dojkabacteria bacterium]|uniref:Glycosyltransferase family 2 protein n=1 Tax=Candidatus Dojkabacteria bacterium TaxID=2099670 RepID=A0A955RM65_9BACT|nr:hypothetical protein [Candidatus Dojkabacteria bacterium]